MNETSIFEAILLIISHLSTRSRKEGAQTAIFYDDDRVHVCRRIPEQTFEIVLHHPRQGEVTVYRAQLRADEQRHVETFREGRWMPHIVRLSERARTMKKNREFDHPRDREQLQSFDDSEMFPEFDVIGAPRETVTAAAREVATAAD